MISNEAEAPTPISRPFLNAVTSLNAQRRDDALYLLSRDFKRSLTQYDICKTQVLADVMQVIETGKVIFGGELRALPFGPVPPRTLDDCKRWTKRWTRGVLVTAFMAFASPAPGPLQECGSMGRTDNISLFRASANYSRQQEASWESFSQTEETNIRNAYLKVISMRWDESQRYFHEPVSAIGYAYEVATRPFPKPFASSTPMNWFDVLDGAEKIEKRDCSYARTMLSLWL